MDRGTMFMPEQSLQCPRCESAATKFCYYNNYNISQPRYFCKDCRRYWTKGGSLRNIPVGGGGRTRKNSKRLSLASTSGVSCKRPSPSLSTGDVQISRRLFENVFESKTEETGKAGLSCLESKGNKESCSVIDLPESFLRLLGDAMGWDEGWLELSMYTPDRRFY